MAAKSASKKPSASAKMKPKKKRVQFAYEAPEARHIAVTGSFCDWNDGYALKKDKKGLWKTAVSLEPGRYEYRFMVDGEWRGDPAAKDRVSNPYGGENDVLVVTA
jgi:1,4-alpha-glucan branching enzyme